MDVMNSEKDRVRNDGEHRRLGIPGREAMGKLQSLSCYNLQKHQNCTSLFSAQELP